MKDELVADFGIASSQVSAAAAFAILILSGFSAPHCGATVYDSDGSVASVQALHNAAHDGDTITLPAGTFSWNTTLLITKAITLKGQTVITGAGTANVSSNDATRILDNTPRSGTASNGVIKVTNNTGQLVRITGLAITNGTQTTPTTGIGGAIRFFGGGVNPGPAPSANNRLDNCHIYDVETYALGSNTDWTYGVTDHCWMRSSKVAFIWYSMQAKYGGDTNAAGDLSWADYPFFGTNKSWFIETSTLDNKGHSLDGLRGLRIVLRYNYMIDFIVHWHGTEGSNIRGGKQAEVYNNTFHHNDAGQSFGPRSGTMLIHDNTRTGVSPTPAWAGCTNNRQWAFIGPDPRFGWADGTAVWDKNATDANGGFTEGAPPYLFESGTSTNTVKSYSTMTDTSKNWTTNQWKFYSIRNNNPASTDYRKGSSIVSNTANTITYLDGGAPLGHGRRLSFSNNDAYQIHQPLQVMDGCGTGKTDRINSATTPRKNIDHGNVPYYAHGVLTPTYNWNNVFTPTGAEMKFQSNRIGWTIREGIEYYNLGKGLSNPPSALTSKYNAALNGVQYNGDYVYPHPLVSGAPTPTPRATPRSQQHLQKKKKNSKKLKRRNWPKKSAI